MKLIYLGKWWEFSIRTSVCLFNTMSESSNPSYHQSMSSAIWILGCNRVYPANKYQCGKFSKRMLAPPWHRTISDVPRVEQIRKLERGRDWRKSTLSNLSVLHWYLHSRPHIEVKLRIDICVRVRAGMGGDWVHVYIIWYIVLFLTILLISPVPYAYCLQINIIYI